MSEWRDYKLGQLAEVLSSKRIFYKDYVDEGIPFYRSKEIIEKTQNKSIDEPLFISEERFKKIKKQFGAPSDGDLLISSVGARSGIPYLVNNDGDFYFKDGNLIWFRNFKDELCSEFLCYWLKSAIGQFELQNMMIGSAQPALTISGLRELDISIPKPEEQKSIASVLSSLDDKIDLLHRQNQTLEQMAETLFRQWFVEESDESWEWRQLDVFVDVHRGLSYKGSGLTDAANGIPMHNLNSVFEGGSYKESGIKYYKGEFKERHKVFPGDIIVTNTEQGHEHLLIGYPAIVPSNFGEYGIFSQHIYRLEIKSTLSNFFLFYLLKTHDVHEQIAGATNGSTVNMLPKDGIEWVKFRLPPQVLIDNFTKNASDYDEKQVLNQTQIRTLTALRDTLLPKLMSGEVWVEPDKRAKKEEV